MRYVILLVVASFLILEAYAGDCGDIKSCTDCGEKDPICWLCLPRSVRSASRDKCLSCTSNCMECELVTEGTKESTNCLTCDPEYILKNKNKNAVTCEKCKTGCMTCSWASNATQVTTNCDTCYVSRAGTYYVQVDKTCMECSSHCTQCIQSTTDATLTTCTACGAGYFLKAGSCSACGGGCETCTEDSAGKKDCTKCFGTSKLVAMTETTTFKCLTCPTACAVCLSEPVASGSSIAKCDSCKDDYYKDTGQCYSCNAGCSKCTSSSVCTECDEEDYYKNGDDCSSCAWKCEKCTEAIKCEECEEDYGKKESTSKTCDKCPSHCTRCDSAGKDGKCDTNRCESGYGRLSDGTCEKCGSNCDACSYSSSLSKLTCDNCADDYTVKSSDGSCQQCPDHCISGCSYSTSASGTICGTCAHSADENYIVNTANQCSACPSNCGNTTGDCTHNSTMNQVVCVTCETGYTQNDNWVCTACPSGCTACSLNATLNGYDCTNSCKDNYRYEEDYAGLDQCLACPSGYNCKTCNDTNCLTCDTEWTLDGDELRCTQCVDKCSGCDWDDSSTSVLCTGCKNSASQNYTLYPASRGECKDCPSNCDQCSWKTAGNAYSGSSAKVECDSGQCSFRYVRIWGDTADSSSGNCKACPSKCRVCTYDKDNKKTLCTTCDAAYVINSGNCKSCGTGCNTCTIDSNAKVSCTGCATGYTILDSEKTCTVCPEHCPTCSYTGSTLKCDTCDSKYGLKDNLCKACPAHCNTCAVNSGETEFTCTACCSEYYMNGESCGKCPDNCDKCEDILGTMTCTDCANTYALDSATKVCKKCPSKCKSCKVSSGKTYCDAGQCDSGSANNQDRSLCPGCPELDATNANCATCLDMADSKSKCTRCNTGFSLKDNTGWAGCVSSATVMGCNTTMIRAVPFGCKVGKCEAGTEQVEEGDKNGNFQDDCFTKCPVCGDIMGGVFLDAATCNKTEPAGYDMEYCVGKYCWAMAKKVGGVLSFARGCSNETCDATYENTEYCKDANGNNECGRCCAGADLASKECSLDVNGESDGAVAITAGLLCLLLASAISYLRL